MFIHQTLKNMKQLAQVTKLFFSQNLAQKLEIVKGQHGACKYSGLKQLFVTKPHYKHPPCLEPLYCVLVVISP
jgi:hypothetical protein